MPFVCVPSEWWQIAPKHMCTLLRRCTMLTWVCGIQAHVHMSWQRVYCILVENFPKIITLHPLHWNKQIFICEKRFGNVFFVNTYNYFFFSILPWNGLRHVAFVCASIVHNKSGSRCAKWKISYKFSWLKLKNWAGLDFDYEANHTAGYIFCGLRPLLLLVICSFSRKLNISLTLQCQFQIWLLKHRRVHSNDLWKLWWK